MEESKNELEQLYGGNIFLPPQILLVLGPASSYHIVKIHYDVDERVEDSNESNLSSSNVLGDAPRNKAHHGVVVDVEECNLLIFFPKNEEYCVQQFADFR